MQLDGAGRVAAPFCRSGLGGAPLAQSHNIFYVDYPWWSKLVKEGIGLHETGPICNSYTSSFNNLTFTFDPLSPHSLAPTTSCDIYNAASHQVNSKISSSVVHVTLSTIMVVYQCSGGGQPFL